MCENHHQLNIFFKQKAPFCSCSVFHSALQSCVSLFFPGVLTFKAEWVFSLVHVCARCGASSGKRGILFAIGHLVDWAAGGGHLKGALMGAASATQLCSEGVIFVFLPCPFAAMWFSG